MKNPYTRDYGFSVGAIAAKIVLSSYKKLQEKLRVLRSPAGGSKVLRQNASSQERRSGDRRVFSRHRDGARFHRREFNGTKRHSHFRCLTNV